MIVRGTVIHCSRFGAIVRLDDGRLAMYRSDEPGMSAVRRASSGGRRPQFPFDVTASNANRIELSLAANESEHASSLDEKIIDYLRQSAERDPRASQAQPARGDERPRADRLLPFELRARRQYRDSPERPKRPKR